MTRIEVEGRTLRVSSLDKVLWPETGFTKGEMLDYYRRVAPALLPHIRGRPLTLGRFPDGVDRYGWYQTNCRGNPDWVTTKRIGTQDYCILDDLAGLLWAANMGAVELHPLLARHARVDEPTAVVFDLDPGAPADVVDCCDVALLVRDALAQLALESFPKTSGSLGLHVYVPLNTPHTYEQTKPFARSIAARLAEAHPNLVVARPPRAVRAGKVFIDWGQNDASKSTVAAYSLRATAWPLVSTPLTWEEVAGARTPGDLAFAPADVLARVGRFGDLFAPAAGLRQMLPVDEIASKT